MKAILSCTADDLYSFNLPFAVYSWYKLGVECIIFAPIDKYDASQEEIFRLGYALGMCQRIAPGTTIIRFMAPADKMATYAQCSRLYAAELPEILSNEILITSDADMCVFNKEYWEDREFHGGFDIIGADLVPFGQYPMCYIAAPCWAWHSVMQIGNRTYQQCLDDLLGGIETENFRGNYWAKDQETAYEYINSADSSENNHDHTVLVYKHNRAKPGTQFATRRCDRDGWAPRWDIIDAHLPRPGYTEENFIKIAQLFEQMYGGDLNWMYTYRNEYVKLMV
jgi:hypothetical protein